MRSRYNILLLFTGIFLFGIFQQGAAQKNNVKPSIEGPDGYRVGSFSGNLSYTRQDIYIESIGPDLEFTFQYKSNKRNRNRGFGYGWTFSFDKFYVQDANFLTIEGTDGGTKTYNFGGDAWNAETGIFDILEEYAPGQFRSTSKDGTQCYFENQTHQRVTKIMDRCQNLVTLTYSDSLVSQITDHTGRSIDLEWTNGNLTKITNSLLAQARVYEYTYNNDGDLVEAKDALGFAVQYVYDDAHRLIQVINKNAVPTHIAYHGTGGVKQIASCDMVMSFSYNPIQSETYVVQQVGDNRSITSYGFDADGRLEEKQGNCCGYNETFVYDADNNIIYVENGNGEASITDFDDRGNPISDTDPEGNTSTKEFEPTFNNVTSFTDALGNTTSYGYDAKGNLLQVSYPLGITNSWTYDAVGNTTSFTDGNSNVTQYEYDTYGYLSKIINPDTSEIIIVNDAVGNVISETDENGHTTTYEYDAEDQQIKITNALGYPTHIIYDGAGNPMQEIDALGQSTYQEFDGLGRVITKTTSLGVNTTFIYDASGNVVESTDGNGNKYKLELNNRGQIVSQTDPMGYQLSIDYDAAGRKIMETDKTGNAMTYAYDANGQLTSMTDALGNTTSMTYDALGRKVSETDARGFTTTFEYDALDRLLVETDPLGYTIEKVYDNNDNLIQETDKRGNIKQYFYNNRNRLIRTEFPEGGIAKYTYDDVGNEITSSLAPGKVETFTYDDINRLIQEENVGGDIRTTTYDSIGRVIKEVLPNGNMIQNEYDADNRLLLQYDLEGLIVAYQYDNASNITQEIDSDSLINNYTYDKLNRQIQVQDQSGRISKIEYNPNGRPTKQIDKDGSSSTFVYNELGLAIEITDALGLKTTFEYDEMANVTAVTDAEGNATSYEFDALNRQMKIIYADGTEKEYVYDANSNVISRIDADNQTSTYVYDDLNRLETKSYPDASTCSFSYDLLGRMTNANNAAATIVFQFDDFDQLISETVNGQSVTYSYDEVSRTKTITYPSGRVVEETMDYRRRPTNVEENSNTVATFQYSGDLVSSMVLGNGLTSTYSYNTDRKLVQYVVNPGPKFKFAYTFDALDNKKSKENLTHTNYSETYGYDNGSRLLGQKRGLLSAGMIATPDDNLAFSYDGVGNRVSANINGTSTSYVANITNAYTSTTTNAVTTNLTHTLTGNLTSDSNQTYTYDFDGRLKTVGGNVTYVYDALGRRFQKNVSGVITTFYYYSDQVIQEDVSGGNTTEHIFAGEIDFRLATITTGGKHYHHLDAIGSVIGLSDASGNVIERYEYDAYGKVKLYDASYALIGSSTVNNRFYFTGKELDQESGLYYMRSRQYHPDLGRFLQRDPLGYLDGMNMYQYVGSNPINLYDPDGLKGCTSFSFKSNDPRDAGKNKRKNLIQRGGIGAIQRAVLTTNVSLSVTGKECEECCSKTKTMGISLSVKATLSGSAEASINGLEFWPASRAIVLAARFAGVEIFAGIKISASVSGSIDKKRDACGKWSGGGCYSGEVSSSGQIYAKTVGRKLLRGHTRANASIGGSLTGFFRTKTCIKCSDTGCKRECDTSYGIEIKAWINVDIKIWGVKVRRSEEWSWDMSSKSKACVLPFI